MTILNWEVGLKSGVIKKIIQHTQTFDKLGYSVDLIYVKNSCKEIFLLSENGEYRLGKSKGIKGISYYNIIRKVVGKAYSVIYVRHSGRIDPWVLGVLKEAKRNGLQVIYEFPTFPYDGHAYSFANKLDLLVDFSCRGMLKKYVDLTVNWERISETYGIPSIALETGIVVQNVKMIESQELDDTIDLIAVASIQPYHKYDKIIRAMHSYYSQGGKRNIVFHIVGEGRNKKKYMDLVSELELDTRVIFYGEKQGEELDSIYEKADIGIGTLGWYTVGVFNTSGALKLREYAAKGLPIISGTKEEIFQSKIGEYYFEVPNDDTDIQMDNIVNFYDSVYGKNKKQDVHRTIRNFTIDNWSMENTLSPLVRYFN